MLCDRDTDELKWPLDNRSCHHSPDSVDHQWHPVASAINESLQPSQPTFEPFFLTMICSYIFYKIFMMFAEFEVARNLHLVFSWFCARPRSPRFGNASPLLPVANGHKSKKNMPKNWCACFEWRQLTAQPLRSWLLEFGCIWHHEIGISNFIWNLETAIHGVAGCFERRVDGVLYSKLGPMTLFILLLKPK